MTPGSLYRSFLILYRTTGLVLLLASVETVLHAAHGGTTDPHVVVLASVEALAAVAFLVPRTMRLGASALLGVFALAFALHATRGELPLQLLAYAAAVLFVRAHGVSHGTIGTPA